VDADPRAPRVALRTLGCKVNRAESEAVAESLLGQGFDLTDEAGADIVVINSCTVTGEADAKTRKAVRRALAAPGEPIVLVTGCLAALDPAGLEAISSRVVAVSDRDMVVERVGKILGGGPGAPSVAGFGRGPLAAIAAPPACRGSLRDPGTSTAGAFRTRVNVKVQDGCDVRCAYCIVPDARGVPTSVAMAEVVGRVTALVARGSAEVVLTGVNIGRYRDGDADLATLVEAVAATDVARIRISSIEPVDLTPRLLDTLSRAPAVMPHLHVPLQSGCDATLAAMRRGYDVAAYADAIARARAALPGLAVTTDVIAGFPGETDADFAESLAFVEGIAFARLHVFRYSRRAGTPAAAMPGQVAPPVSAQRARAMRSLGERLSATYATSRVGETASVLVERVEGALASGTSEDYLRVRVRTTARERERVRPGDVVRVAITSAERGGAWARLAEC
jgi:threonylcarbamoyladenosine tRNA methylthiotransferase MtaB